MKPALSCSPETKSVTFPPWRDERELPYSLDHLLGAFAMWAIRQSPYTCPDDLKEAIDKLGTELSKRFKFDKWGFCRLKCDTIRETFEKVFEKVKVIEQWNHKKQEGHNSVSRDQEGYNPDFDFISLDAMARNIAHSMITEYLVWER